ncbi:heterokaryon incompatibility protein-domain-containing protein [Fusarium flagelliforme]|uniref:Heterokaryon incompatibility domain-containing protein n=1 Tax=Fusarium flagelliforme TaxID=2675880 RepID=A0A395MX93_9HYPO|nr:heterokaryon incompatibility protein-domain-containing protein [Fusarium flagelliforme]KAH7198572.1 heterokaryon incompatibility protein-domain-containing protein [Fusarium flagelliforme]RFN52340.1 hypothetical protein FIE12Z_3365 [Fusarium flagelliforme]
MAPDVVADDGTAETEHTYKDESKKRFQYPVLLPSDIRILELNPGKHGDPLTGTILHRTLLPDEDEIPYYNAISYFWGDQSEPDSITLAQEHHIRRGGSLQSQTPAMGQLAIGKNLAAALRALRDHQKKRNLWCDSICINQSDLHDRATQVQMIHHIYHCAASVVMWLGPETSWSVLAMDTLRSCADLVESVTMNHSIRREIFAFKDPANHGVLARDGLPLTVNQRQAIEKVLALDWHRRLWTHQEAVLANKLTSVVMLGYEEISWKDFRHAVSLICFLMPSPRDAVDDIVAYNNNAEIVGGRILACADDEQKSDYWLGALTVTGYMECSDDRDRIYALRGLVEPDVAKSIEVDYTRSLKEIFTSVCLDEITRQRDLDFMTLCNAATSPSWVADLERSWGNLVLDSNAAGNSAPAVSLIEPHVLEVTGVACDEILTEPQPHRCKALVETAAEFRQKTLYTLLALVNEESLQDDTVLDQLIMMLTWGSVRDYSTEKLHPPQAHSLRSLEGWRGKIRKWLRKWLMGDVDDTQDPLETDDGYIKSLPIGTSAYGCVKTRRGDFIRVPMHTRKGDIVAAFLGLTTSIILRPQATDDSYLVIGAGYHPGFSAAQAFLGGDFHGWDRLWNREFMMYGFYKEGHPIRYTDPRLDGVPFTDGFVEVILDGAQSGMPVWARDGHGFSMKDPRISEAALRERDVRLQKFRLI